MEDPTRSDELRAAYQLLHLMDEEGAAGEAAVDAVERNRGGGQQSRSAFFVPLSLFCNDLFLQALAKIAEFRSHSKSRMGDGGKKKVKRNSFAPFILLLAAQESLSSHKR